MESYTEENPDSKTKVTKKKMWSVPLLIFFVAFIIIFIVVAVIVSNVIQSSNLEKQLKEQLALGEKYLSELDYEQAVASYEQAVEIDPKSEKAYMGLSETYVAMGDYENAIRVLKEGYAETESEAIKRRLEAVELSNTEQSEVLLEINDSDEVQGHIPEGVYGFERQTTEEGVNVYAENFEVSTNYSTDEIVITLEGLSIQDENNIGETLSSEDYASKYYCEVVIYGKDETYMVATLSSIFDPEVTTVWKVSEEDMVYADIGSAKLQYAENSMTWTFDSSQIENLDFTTVDKYTVEISVFDVVNETREYICLENQ